MQKQTTNSTATIAALAGLTLAAAAATAQVPTEWTIEMQARTGAGVVTPFNLPAPATLASSQTIAIDNDGAVVFRVSSIDNDVDNNGIFYGKDGTGGLIVGPTTAADYASDMDIANGRIALAFGGFNGTGGEIRNTDGALFQDAPAGGPLGVTNFSGLQINSAGYLGYRTEIGGTTHWVVDDPFAVPREQTSLAAEGATYSFLFTPNVNDNRHMAGKALLASGGNVIIRIDETGAVTTIAEDTDANAAAPYNRFFNSTSMNNLGEVCFYGRRASDSVFELVRSDGVTSTVIAAEGDPVGMFDAIDGFASFKPAINDQGWVAFRADQTFGETIFVGDGTSIARVIGEGDTVNTPQGQFFIGQGESTTFVSAPDINESGQISFIAKLGDDSLAAFVATPVIDCPADLNGDGMVDVFDLLDYLDDWFAGDADRTGDGMTDVFDLLDYLDAWFAGC